MNRRWLARPDSLMPAVSLLLVVVAFVCSPLLGGRPLQTFDGYNSLQGFAQLGLLALAIGITMIAGEFDLSSLRLAVVGGAPMPPALPDTWRRRDVEILEGYGLTEAAPNVIYGGLPYPYLDLSLSDEGELLVAGRNVVAGYWRNEGATREAFTVDGRLRTGDVAELDADGRYRIRGRLKDLVISGGENVYPAEVERVLLEAPGVAAGAVVGVPDARLGEVGRAYLVARPGCELDADAVLAFCRERLANYKVPRQVVLRGSLPRNASGKTLKRLLRETPSAEPDSAPRARPGRSPRGRRAVARGRGRVRPAPP